MKKSLIILIGILLLCACEPGAIGGKQVSSKSKNYYKGWLGYYYSPGNNTFEVDYKPLEVDKKSFEVLAAFYAKDNKRVFYRGTRLPANPATFTVLSEEFAKDDQNVFYMGKVVESADAKSFYLNKTGVPMDKYHVFVCDGDFTYRPSTIPMDRETVEKIYPNQMKDSSERALLKDKNGVYAGDVKMPVDAKTFRRYEWYGGLPGDRYWHDKNGYYLEGWDSTTERLIFKDANEAIHQARLKENKKPADGLSR